MASTVTLTENNALETSIRLRPSSPLQNERDTEIVILEDFAKSLGIKVVGGRSEEHDRDFGLFIRRILPGGLAAEDGRIQEGDLILSVNDESLRHMTNEKGVALLRKASASSYMKLVLARDEKAREEYQDFMESHQGNSFSTSVSVMSSRASTPAIPPGLNLHHVNASWFAADLRGADEMYSQASTASGRSTPRFEETQSNQIPLNMLSDSNQNYTEHYSKEDSISPPSYPPTFSEGSTVMPLYHAAPVPLAVGIRAQPNMVSTPYTNALKQDFKAAKERENGPKPWASSSSLPAQTQQNDKGYAPGASPNGARRTSDPAYSTLSHPMSGMSTIDPSPVIPTPSKDQSRSLTPTRMSKFSKRDERYRTIDPHARIKVEKLEVALRYLGFDPTSEQHLELRNKLQVNESGMVNYEHFVAVAQDVFKYELKNMPNSPGARYISAQDFTEPPQYVPDLLQSKFTAPFDEDTEHVKRERDQLRREVERLRIQLREKEASCSRAEEELLRIRKEAQGAIHESRTLKTKVYLAEQAQKAARNMEQDYEEVVRLLESEISDLRAQQAKQLESPEVQKRLQVLNGQVRKAEVSKKTYEVATDKLLQFAELVHSTLGNQEAVLSNPGKGDPSKGGKPPGYLGKHKKMTAQALAQEAKDVVKAVNSLIEIDPLPYGWEEAYTADGVKYYIKSSPTPSSPRRGVREPCNPNDDMVASRLPRPASSQTSRARPFEEEPSRDTDIIVYGGLSEA